MRSCGTTSYWWINRFISLDNSVLLITPCTSDPIWHPRTLSLLVQIMVCLLFGALSLTEPVITYYQFHHQEQTYVSETMETVMEEMAVLAFSFVKVPLEMSGKWWAFCWGLNALRLDGVYLVVLSAAVFVMSWQIIERSGLRYHRDGIDLWLVLPKLGNLHSNNISFCVIN